MTNGNEFYAPATNENLEEYMALAGRAIDNGELVSEVKDAYYAMVDFFLKCRNQL